jgi:hypothetical protein
MSGEGKNSLSRLKRIAAAIAVMFCAVFLTIGQAAAVPPATADWQQR